jgi:hypothetical protein
MGKGKMPFIDIHSLNVEKEYNEREEKWMKELNSKDYVGWWINPQPLLLYFLRIKQVLF